MRRTVCDCWWLASLRLALLREAKRRGERVPRVDYAFIRHACEQHVDLVVPRGSAKERRAR